MSAVTASQDDRTTTKRNKDIGSAESGMGLMAALYAEDGQSLDSRLCGLKNTLSKICTGEDVEVEDRRFLASFWISPKTQF